MQETLALGTGLLLTAVPATGWAQSAADKAVADTLFNEGKKLLGRNDTLACEKFEASLAKATQLGTQLALASCYEKVGRTASAWGEFRAAASAAAKAHDQRQRFAEEHAGALEPRLSKIAIMSIANRVDGLEIRRDGAEVPPAELGTAVPVDPGEHVVEASAPGRVAWSIKVAVPATPGVVDVPVPALEKDAAVLPSLATARLPADPGTAASAPVTPAPPRRTLAYAVGGGGAGMIGVSLVLGALASSRWNDARPHCHAGLCDRTGFDLAGSAHTLGNVSTGAFVVGAGALAAGVYLWLTARPPATETQPADHIALHFIPRVDSSAVGLTLEGGF